jgi:hypothetical protein
MTNYFYHTRTRARTYEYSKLTEKELKSFTQSPVNTTLNLSWHHDKDTKLNRKAKITEKGLYIWISKNEGYHIHFDETELTYGKRKWYRCPRCYQRCAILYHAGIFACRHCVKPAYESQNGSKMDYLADRIIKDRKKLFGDESPFVNDLTETCQWWPKPKGVHWQRFKRERDKILAMENKRHQIWMIGVEKFLNRYDTLSAK